MLLTSTGRVGDLTDGHLSRKGCSQQLVGAPCLPLTRLPSAEGELGSGQCVFGGVSLVVTLFSLASRRRWMKRA